MSTIIDTFIAPPCHQPIGILYQDKHLLLINKPAGLLSLSGKIRRISTRCIIGWRSNFPAVPSFTAWILAPPG
jgi:23S rRNA-/tRNA-specific pseudouridylate synthase